MDDDAYKVLTPDLYRTNLFRVLGLPVTAQGRDVQRREARRELEARLGLSKVMAAAGSLALDPPPGQDEVRMAVARLHTPFERFRAEFFWFWPLDDGLDRALRAVEEGRLTDAAAIWRSETSLPDRRAVARHNLAVFFHLLALDREHALAAGAADAMPRTELEALWPRALGQWAEVHADPAFWQVVSRRAATLNDAKVSQHLVTQVRNSLPTGLLHIHARLAFAAAAASRSTDVMRHLKLLEASGFDAAARQSALRHALALWEDQVKEAIDRARTTWRAAPHRANESVRLIHQDCSRLISIVDAVVDNVADPLRPRGASVLADVRNDLRDMVAEAMFHGQLTFTTRIDDWGESAELLELARKMAVSDTLRVVLDRNLSSVRENAKIGSEWCAPGYWDLPEATIARLEEARAAMHRSDFESALRLLSTLPLSIERPLRRAASHCLTAWGVQIFNVALREFREEPSIRRRLIDRYGADRSPLRRFPDDELPDFLKPPCPSCGSQEYARWSRVEIRDIAAWLCGDCADTLAREIEGKRNAFRGALAQALERQMLADEIYPDDPRSKLNLGILEQHAREVHCALPGTASLKARIHRSEHFVLSTPPASLEDAACHFCGDAPPSPDCAIQLPMCGDVEREQRLLGQSTSIRTTMVVVPRCQSCRDAHLDLGSRRVRWREKRAEMSRTMASGPGLEARLAVVLAGALAWGGVAYGVHAAMIGDGPSPAGWMWPVAIGFLAAVGVGAGAAVGLRRALAVKADAAMRRFMAEMPEPSLAPGIKPEQAYVDFATVRELRRRKWSFGHVYAPEQAAPQDVVGLVEAAA